MYFSFDSIARYYQYLNKSLFSNFVRSLINTKCINFPQKFTLEDHLAVHMRKHEMSLALNLLGEGCSMTSGKSPLSGLGLPGLFLGTYVLF